jgi:hypothetical protein
MLPLIDDTTSCRLPYMKPNYAQLYNSHGVNGYRNMQVGV